MRAHLRRIGLISHVASSVGWLGSAAAFVALAAATVRSDDRESISLALRAMDVVFFAAIVPFAVASTAIAVGQSLLSPYGLVRHWWVVVKLLLTGLATAVVLMYGETMSTAAELARDPATPAAELRTVAMSPLLHAVAGGGVLLVALVISIYKPRGLTALGWRWEDEQRRRRENQRVRERC